MDDIDYQLLLNLFETRNITKTAKNMFLSQPAITKRIHGIETELGAELLIRGNKGVIFTAAGASIISECRRVVDARRLIESTLDREKDIVSGNLNIAASLNYARYHLPVILKEYLERYPLVNIKMTTAKSKHLSEIIQSREDCVAVLRGEYSFSGHKQLLMTEPMCLIRSYSNADMPLSELGYIGHQTDAQMLKDTERWAMEHGVGKLTEKTMVDDIGCCKAMAECGAGWCIVPKICLGDFKGYVEELSFLDGTPFIRSTYVFCHESYMQLKQVRLFIEYLMEFETEHH